MNIRILNKQEYYKAKEVYKAVFPEDSDGFVEYYFKEVASDNTIYVLEDGEKVCSMIHLNPYRVMINGDELPIHYIVAVATLKEERSKGYMGMLLRRVLNDMHTAGEVITYLMPVAEAIYTPYDFRTVSEKHWEYFADLSDSEKKFARIFCDVDAPMYAQHVNEYLSDNYQVYTYRDDAYYKRLIKEYNSDKAELMAVTANGEVTKVVPQVTEPSLIDTKYMVRILDIKRLLSILKLTGETGGVIKVSDSIIADNCGDFAVNIDLKKYGVSGGVDIARLTEIIFDSVKVRFDETV